MNILIINGPNLNLLGKREPETYGKTSFQQYLKNLEDTFIEHDIQYKQSNVEGELINFLHDADETNIDVVILNPGGYSHTSVSLSDAIASIQTPVIEVHISNIYAREEYRHQSITGKNCIGVITGFGLSGYDMAIRYALDFLRSNK